MTRDGVATTLLVRALFDDYLRNLKSFSADLKDMVEIVEKGIKCSNYAGSVNAMFGVADLASASVSILPAGLESNWASEHMKHHISGDKKLGEGCLKNFITRDMSMDKVGQLSVGRLGSSSFNLRITRKIQVA